MSVMLTSTLNAQVTITRDDLPKPNTMVIRAVDTLMNPNPGNSGNNQTWDFSSAQVSYIDTLLYLSPSEVPEGNLFENSNLVEGRVLSDAAMTFNNYYFYDVRDEGLYGKGWTLFLEVPMFSTYESITTYDSDPLLVPFPLIYLLENEGTTTSHTYSKMSVMPFFMDSTYVKSQMSVSLIVDGQGTLTTPSGTYNALRLVERSVSVDSTFTFGDTFEWEFDSVNTYEQVTYHWYANGIGEVATLYEEGETNQFQYFTKSQVTGVEKILRNISLKIFPNPTSGILYYTVDQPVKFAEVFSLSGQLIRSIQGNQSIDISNLSSGVYILKVHLGEGVVINKFVKD